MDPLDERARRVVDEDELAPGVARLEARERRVLTARAPAREAGRARRAEDGLRLLEVLVVEDDDHLGDARSAREGLDAPGSERTPGDHDEALSWGSITEGRREARARARREDDRARAHAGFAASGTAASSRRPKSILPALVWIEEVMTSGTSWPTFSRAPSITTMVPSSR